MNNDLNHKMNLKQIALTLDSDQNLLLTGQPPLELQSRKLRPV